MPGKVKILASGSSHAVVVDTLDNIYIWGENNIGELGTTPLNCSSFGINKL